MQKSKRLTVFFLSLTIWLVRVPVKTRAAEYTQVPAVTARNVLILDRETGRILYEKSGFEKVAMASTTKMMTALLIRERCELSDSVTVSRTAAQITGSTMHLAEGETVTVRTLLYGLLLCSGNDAAVALAEFSAGSVPAFCEIMNRKAAMLGLSDTHFTSPHGLDDPDHYTTAFDLARLADAFMKDPVLSRICETRSAVLEGHSMTNTNPLLGQNAAVNGIKTGYTGNAGYCLVVSAENETARFIIVLLNAPSSQDRRNDAQKLTVYCTENYRLYDLYPKGYALSELNIRHGADSGLTAVLPERVRLVLTKSEREKLNTVFEPISSGIAAPVRAGTAVGRFSVRLGEETLYQTDAVAFRTVPEISYWACFLHVITEFVYLFDS